MKKVILFFALIFLVGFQGNSSAELEAAQSSVTGLCFIVTYPLSQGGDGSCYSYESQSAAAAEHNIWVDKRIKTFYNLCEVGCPINPL